MGLFDRLAGTKKEQISPQVGLLLSAITMIAADGVVDDDELAILRRLDSGGTAFDVALRAFKSNSFDDCISLATKAMNPEQRLVAMANLVDIAMADGYLHGSEKELLEAYVDAFSIESSIVETIVEVIAIKNNKDLFD